jgi:hypothetical protein
MRVFGVDLVLKVELFGRLWWLWLGEKSMSFRNFEEVHFLFCSDSNTVKTVMSLSLNQGTQ